MCFGTVTSFDNLQPINLKNGQEFKVRIKSLPLLAGMYSLLVIVADEIALHPYDSHRTKNFSVGPGRRIRHLIHGTRMGLLTADIIKILGTVILGQGTR